MTTRDKVMMCIGAYIQENGGEDNDIDIMLCSNFDLADILRNFGQITVSGVYIPEIYWNEGVCGGEYYTFVTCHITGIGDAVILDGDSRVSKKDTDGVIAEIVEMWDKAEALQEKLKNIYGDNK